MEGPCTRGRRLLYMFVDAQSFGRWYRVACQDAAAVMQRVGQATEVWAKCLGMMVHLLAGRVGCVPG